MELPKSHFPDQMLVQLSWCDETERTSPIFNIFGFDHCKQIAGFSFSALSLLLPVKILISFMVFEKRNTNSNYVKGGEINKKYNKPFNTIFKDVI